MPEAKLVWFCFLHIEYIHKLTLFKTTFVLNKRLPAQNWLFGIGRRGTANSPKCFSILLPFALCPLPFALHLLTSIDKLGQIAMLVMFINQFREKGIEKEMYSGVSPPGRTTTLVFILFPKQNVMQCFVHCAKCIVQSAKCGVQSAICTVQSAMATTTLVFIFFPQPGTAPSWLWPNPCFYLLLIDPLSPETNNNNNNNDTILVFIYF